MSLIIGKYKGVIIFYLLLILFLFAMAYQNSLTDMKYVNDHLIVTNN